MYGQTLQDLIDLSKEKEHDEIIKNARILQPLTFENLGNFLYGLGYFNKGIFSNVDYRCLVLTCDTFIRQLEGHKSVTLYEIRLFLDLCRQYGKSTEQQALKGGNT